MSITLKKYSAFVFLILISQITWAQVNTEVDVIDPTNLEPRNKPYQLQFENAVNDQGPFFIELTHGDGTDLILPDCSKAKGIKKIFCKASNLFYRLCSYQRVNSVEVILNDTKVIHKKEFHWKIGTLVKEVHLTKTNYLKIKVKGERHSSVLVRLYRVGNEQAPVPRFVWRQVPDSSKTIYFDGSGSTDDGSIESFEWNFGDGESGSGPMIQHTYDSDGQYNVRLTVSDNAGLQSTLEQSVLIQSNQSPVANVQSNVLTGEAPLMVMFDGSGSNDPDNDPLSYQWDFGDGSGAQGINTAHLFENTGSYTVTLLVQDGKGGESQASLSINVLPVQLPPDPSTIAPPLPPGENNSLMNSLSFLYENNPPVQRNVVASLMDQNQISWIRGRVLDRNNSPISGVKISVLDHPEFGFTYSRLDGAYDFVLNGGMSYTLDFQSSSYLPLQRRISPLRQSSQNIQNVVLVPLDTKILTIQNNSPIPQLLSGSEVVDNDGSRTGTVFIPPNTTGEIVLPDGSRQTLQQLNLRITEYTVGENGPLSMPGTLPPTNEYTYAMELSVDEAISQGSNRVEFNQPVSYYVDNFLNIPVGIIVPFGFYNTNKGIWESERNGIVTSVLSIVDGKAVLDVDGSGQHRPELEAALDLTDEELTTIANLFSPGQSFWRVRIDHFSAYDLNYAAHLLSNLNSPDNLDGHDTHRPTDGDNKTCMPGGSFIEYETQSFGENMPVYGTPFFLTYKSDRTPGYLENATIRLNLSNRLDLFSSGVAKARFNVAGTESAFVQSDSGFAPEISYIWDGKDAFNRSVNGLQKVEVETSTVGLDSFYRLNNYCDITIGESPNQCAQRIRREIWGLYTKGDELIADRKNLTRRQVRRKSYFAGVLDWRDKGFGGWSLNIHHSFDPLSNRLYRGDGQTRIEEREHIDPIVQNCIQQVGGCTLDAQNFVDGTPAIGAVLQKPSRMAFRGDGSLIVGDDAEGSFKIRRINPQGLIYNLAGFGADSTSDNIPSSNVAIEALAGLEVLPSGEIIYGDGNRVRKIDLGGQVYTLAGSHGLTADSGDGGPASQAGLSTIVDLAVSDDGSIFIASSHGVRKISPDGNINPQVGRQGPSGGVAPDDGAFATEVDFSNIASITVDSTGQVYVASNQDRTIYRVQQDGILQRIAGLPGAGTPGQGDRGEARLASLSHIGDILIDSEFNLFIGSSVASEHSGSVRKVTADGFIDTVVGVPNNFSNTIVQNNQGTPVLDYLSSGAFSLAIDDKNRLVFGEFFRISRVDNLFAVAQSDGTFRIPSRDGSEIYVFDENGRHLETRNSMTRSTKYSFNYENNFLTSVVDGDGKITQFIRNGLGEIEKIASHYGIETAFNLDSEGYLSEIKTPENDSYHFTYNSKGLLTRMDKPNGAFTIATYDPQGFLQSDEDALGGLFNLQFFRPALNTTITTAEGRESSIKINPLTQNFLTSEFRDKDGSKTTTIYEGANTGVERENISFYNGRVKQDDFLPGHLINEDVVYNTNGSNYVMVRDRKVTYADPLNPESSEFTIEDSFLVDDQFLTREIYNSSNNETQIITPEGRIYKTQSDDQGRILRTEIQGLHPVQYEYDSDGRLLKIMQGSRETRFGYDTKGYLNSMTNALGQTTQFINDNKGQVTRQVLNDNREILFDYDGRGNLTGVTPPSRGRHELAYNAQDLLTSYKPPHVGAVTGQIDYQYNLDKELTQIQRADSRNIDFQYNDKGQLARMISSEGASDLTYTNTGQLGSVTSEDNISLALFYNGDQFSRMNWTAPGYSQSITTYFNNRHMKESDTIGGSLNPDGDGLPTEDSYYGITYTFNSQNTLLESVNYALFGNPAEQYTYNAYGELTSHSFEFNSTQFGTSYTRDNLGRILSIQEKYDSGQENKSFTYDSTGRLHSATDARGVTTYTYDSNNNITQVSGPEGIFTGTYDAQDRLISFGSIQYFYNDHGELNRKLDTSNNEESHYSYDSYGNLKNVTLPSGQHIQYEVDGFNRRISRSDNGGASKDHYVYKDQLNITRVVKANGEIQDFSYISKPHVPDLMEINRVQYRIITDHLGSVREVRNQSGQVVQAITYDAYGKVLSDTNPGFQPFGYAGGLYDHQTGLVRFGARDYDGEVGRWISKDPILFDGGSPNLYSYAANDPINFIDIEGEYAIAAPGVGIGGGIGIGAGGAIGIGAGIGIGICYAIDCTGIGEQIGSDLYDLLNPNVESRRGGKGKGERGRTRNPEGTPNPNKHRRPHPTDPNKIIQKDPHTGKQIIKPKPPGFPNDGCN